MPPQQQASGLAPQQMGPGGFLPSTPQQKTIVAGMAPPIMQGQPMQPGMHPGMPMQ